ncbi:MAG: flavodoxin [Lachnospiraceae bacterium]|nr:flavodoxin [Lachnospiraceae bacterium]
MKKRVVVYYSFEGNTKRAAEQLAEKLGADIVELRTVKEIPRKGIGKFFVGGGQALFKKCPPLRNMESDMGKYEEIILGTPIWAGKCAPAINSFLKAYPVEEKVAAIFTSSGGGDNKSCMKDFSRRFSALKYSAALYDSRNPASKDNEMYIQRLAEDIMHGE